MTPWLSRSGRHAALVCLVALAGCAAPVAQGPRVAVMPPHGKPLEVFSAEDQTCRSYVEQTAGAQSDGSTVAASAVIGTVIGAAVGAAVGGRHDHTANGAAAGLVMGTAVGLNHSAVAAEEAQRRYDIAYEQCMSTKNNMPGRTVYRVPVPSPAVVAAAPYSMAAPYPPPPPGR